MQTMPDEIIDFARQYPFRIVWADNVAIADALAIRMNASFSMPSPNGRDANDLLKEGLLERLLQAMLKKIGYVAPATIGDLTDYVGQTVDGPTWTALQTTCQQRHNGLWAFDASAEGEGYHVCELHCQ